jgi:hypothetical protein
MHCGREPMMYKYRCGCGEGFRNKKDADIHLQLAPATDGYVHLIAKKYCRTRLIDFLLINFSFITRYFAFITLFGMLIQHFHINFNLMESALFGISMGFLINNK